jgi:hypothetical protein
MSSCGRRAAILASEALRERGHGFFRPVLDLVELDIQCRGAERLQPVVCVDVAQVRRRQRSPGQARRDQLREPTHPWRRLWNEVERHLIPRVIAQPNGNPIGKGVAGQSLQIADKSQQKGPRPQDAHVIVPGHKRTDPRQQILGRNPGQRQDSGTDVALRARRRIDHEEPVGERVKPKRHDARGDTASAERQDVGVTVARHGREAHELGKRPFIAPSRYGRSPVVRRRAQRFRERPLPEDIVLRAQRVEPDAEIRPPSGDSSVV